MSKKNYVIISFIVGCLLLFWAFINDMKWMYFTGVFFILIFPLIILIIFKEKKENKENKENNNSKFKFIDKKTGIETKIKEE